MTKQQILEEKIRKMVREEMLAESSAHPFEDKVNVSFEKWLSKISKPYHHPRAIAAIVSTYIKNKYNI